MTVMIWPGGAIIYDDILACRVDCHMMTKWTKCVANSCRPYAVFLTRGVWMCDAKVTLRRNMKRIGVDTIIEASSNGVVGGIDKWV